jgi:hypothetical protein
MKYRKRLPLYGPHMNVRKLITDKGTQELEEWKNRRER